jgi:DNA-directed RNA polymerase subunit RPC12/RpoP
MAYVHEALGSADQITPELSAALATARMYDAAQAMLVYHCSTCKGVFGEESYEAVIKRAAANTHGEAITPELEAAVRIARIRDEAMALLVYQCGTCKGSFDEETYEAVIKRAAANTHGEAITPLLEAALASPRAASVH